MNFLRRLKFDFWYLGNPPWDSGVTPPEVFEFLQSHPAGRALDIGCGSGTNVVTLVNAGWQVTGFDFSTRAIRNAKRKIKRARAQAELFTDDATRMKKVKGQFDLALDIGCFHGIPNKADYLSRLKRVLAPNGFWLMYGFLAAAESADLPSVTPADLKLISEQNLALVSRRDGFDGRERPSAWFLHRKP
jgi:ubiquinone/menaquinone biosynthesis C-methylase UbiE